MQPKVADLSSHVKRQGDDVLRAVTRRFAALGDTLTAHERLATALRETIDAGDLHPGDPLPGDSALIEATGLARGTVRQAPAPSGATGMAKCQSTCIRRPEGGLT